MANVRIEKTGVEIDSPFTLFGPCASAKEINIIFYLFVSLYMLFRIIRNIRTINKAIMSILFSPLKINSLEFRNRIAVSPMCTYSSTNGFASDWHLVHLGSRAMGGAGLVMTEATAISPEGRISPDDLGIWQDEHIKNLAKITSFIEQHGAIPGIQLAHAGRKASTSSEWKGGGSFLLPEQGGWDVVAPSPLPFSEYSGIPHELTKGDIQLIISQFALAARRSLIAGFKVVEIHAAHGYLIHQFLSPLTNLRTDEYGGSFENRIRFLLEVIDAVQKVWNPDYPLFVRISATDWVDEGWDLSQSARLSSLLKDKGVDLMDVSSGGSVADVKIPVGYGYQLPFASYIRKEADMMVGAVGMIVNAVQAETILRNNDADLLFMGRQLLRDPYFPLHAAKELGEPITWPVQYRRAK